jgi:hypothetical protein
VILRRYAVTIRQPGQPRAVASRHLTLRAARRRAHWLRGLTALAGADVRPAALAELETPR